MMQKTIIRFVPAGMNVGVKKKSEDDSERSTLSTKLQNKKKLTQAHLDTVSSDKTVNATREQSSQEFVGSSSSASSSVSECSNHKENVSMENSKLSPPKVICRNRSIVLNDLDFKGIENSIFNIDTQSIKLPSATVKHVRTEQQQELNEVEQINSKTVHVDVAVNFKDKLLHVIHKPKQTEQNNKANIDNEDNDFACGHIDSEVLENKKKAPERVIIESEKTAEDEKDKQTVPIRAVQENWYNNNILFNELNNEFSIKKGLPLLKTTSVPVKIVSVADTDILIHGVYVRKPVNSLKKTHFNKDVLKVLESMECTTPTIIQSYMWPTIQRGLNVFMVGPKKSGKTLSYLPALCTFAMRMSEKYIELGKYKGPSIIIVCLNNSKCQEIYNTINNLVENSLDTPKIAMLTSAFSVENCDILVVTFSELEKCLKSETLSLKRLCHLALEDASFILRENSSFINNFFELLNDMKLNRPHNKNIQIIVSSEKWSTDLDMLMKKLYLAPVLCFVDFLEAALYFSIKIVRKKLNPESKMYHLAVTLREKYLNNKSIVFCDEHEISEIKEYLETKGIECISISNYTIEDEIFENEDMWCALKMGRFKVLLSTDQLFEKTVNIMDANWLIHYSPPSDWTTFQRRFRSLAANIRCPLNSSEADHFIENICYIFTTGSGKKSSIFNDFLNRFLNEINYI